MAFLESDKLKVKSKYDIVRDVFGCNEQGNPKWDLVKSTDAYYKDRTEYAEAISRKYIDLRKNPANGLESGSFNNYYCLTSGSTVCALNAISLPEINHEEPTVIVADVKANSRGSTGTPTLKKLVNRSTIDSDGDLVLSSDDELEEYSDDDDADSIRESVESKQHEYMIEAELKQSDVQERPISLAAPVPVTPAKTFTQRASDMVSNARNAAVARKKKQSVPLTEQLQLPEKLLTSLSSLLSYVNANELTRGVATDAAECEGNCADFLTLAELVCLDIHAIGILYELENSVKESENVSITQSTSLNASTLDNYSILNDIEHGAWISQFRIRNAILHTTAFQDILRKSELLKRLKLQELEKRAALPNTSKDYINWSNSDRYAFCLMLPWPGPAAHSSLTTGFYSTGSFAPLLNAVIPTYRCNAQRILWQMHAKYKIGNGTVSLLQLEHGILRAMTPDRLHNLVLIANSSASCSYYWPTIVPGLDVSSI